ncbi:nucleotide sugar dehydrogenase [Candidatus Dependentiae bacterium]|nr:nucleotide sugar dehydrogenase [Candidatus Dependentiae bacterium]
MRKVAVVGAGYVGLVTGACFAQKDNFVIIVERDISKIEKLQKGNVPFYEPGLDQLVTDAIINNRIVFVQNIADVLKHHPEIIFSCVGTPSMQDGKADLSAVWGVAKEVGQSLDRYCLFVNKSTVPVGTAIKVETIISKELKKRELDFEFDVASNPEFLKEGDALHDFLIPDRVVVGINSEKAKQILYSLYRPFIKQDEQFIVMNRESSELTKYASNAMLATRISFMNQLSLLADKVGADISQIKLGMALDKRIGPCFLNAGIGYGGSCFPKDVKALINTGEENDCEMSLVSQVDKINEDQKKWFIEHILNFYGKEISKKVIGIWGLAFKPETDDIRCAPSIDVIEKLLEQKAKIIAYDPVAWKNMKSIFGDKIIFKNTAKEVLEKSDCLIVLTEWREFLNSKIQNFCLLKDKTVFDARNIFDPFIMKNNNIKYFSIGRNNINNIKKDLDFLKTTKEKQPGSCI